MKPTIAALIIVAVMAIPVCLPANAADFFQRYRDATDRCAGLNVRRLDDKLTSAEIVAEVLLEQCKAASFDLWNAATKGKTGAYKAGYLQA
ncbi:MAG: hypothetical protein KGO94_13640, partial [Alphaproteobacteria bacterium]|nr:hypothetical protein [Alphaproteobacteria bacterium]